MPPYRKLTYTCRECKHLFESKKLLAAPDRVCGMCVLKMIYGKPKEKDENKPQS